MSSTQKIAVPTPTPISYSPSQEFDGNDGKWFVVPVSTDRYGTSVTRSSFVVRVGTPSQNFRVLPSSNTGEVFVPIVDGCMKDNTTNCGGLRGVYDFNGKFSNGFLVNSSSSWHEIGIYDMAVRPELGFNANGLYGLDTVGLMLQNSGGPTLDNRVVAGVSNPAIWVGVLGLGPKASNFSEFDNPQKSLMQALKAEDKIPSLSYGYTAGASYRTPKALGSLTLGGFDQSRFDANDVTFPFDPDDSRLLSVNIQSLVARDSLNGSVNLLHEPTYVQIDFTVPHLWLPVSTCDRIAAAFQLKYDNTTDLYLVNDTVHAQLQQRNPSITVGLGTTADPGKRVNIVLPYSAFDLQASHPIYPNATNYFPIRRAFNESMYTLGRTLMQEAYIKVNYERGNFSVHQARFRATTEKDDIVSITSPGKGALIDRAATKSSHLSKGSIAGISIGAAALLAIPIFVLFWRFWRMKCKSKPEKLESIEVGEELPDQCRHEKDGPAFFEIDGVQFAELHCQGLQVVVDVESRCELGGYEFSGQLSDSQSVSIKELEAGELCNHN